MKIISSDFLALFAQFRADLGIEQNISIRI